MTRIDEAVVVELRSAREQDRPCAQIRITQDAVPGSAVLVPMTPERARALGAVATCGVTGPPVATADPAHERLTELLIHPDDWRLFLVEVSRFALTDVTAEGVVKSVYGIRVSADPA